MMLPPEAVFRISGQIVTSTSLQCAFCFLDDPLTKRRAEVLSNPLLPYYAHSACSQSSVMYYDGDNCDNYYQGRVSCQFEAF